MEYNNTLLVLEKSGWHKGRRVDVSELEENLLKLGYEVFEPVKFFLEEFGLLKIVDEKNDDFHDTSVLLTNYFNNGSFKQLESYAGERLVPVGKICRGYQLLFVSESGKIYCDTGKLGDTPWEAWESLINHTGFKDWGDLQKEQLE